MGAAGSNSNGPDAFIGIVGGNPGASVGGIPYNRGIYEGGGYQGGLPSQHRPPFRPRLPQRPWRVWHIQRRLLGLDRCSRRGRGSGAAGRDVALLGPPRRLVAACRQARSPEGHPGLRCARRLGGTKKGPLIAEPRGRRAIRKQAMRLPTHFEHCRRIRSAWL